MPETPGAKFARYVRNGGRITIPKETLTALGLKEGDIVELTIKKIKTPLEENPDKR